MVHFIGAVGEAQVTHVGVERRERGLLGNEGGVVELNRAFDGLAGLFRHHGFHGIHITRTVQNDTLTEIRINLPVIVVHTIDLL